MRLHMCQVYVCTAQDVVLCVGQASLPVSCCGCFVAGALRRPHAEGRQPPNPEGWTSRSRRASNLDRPPGRPCRESPGLFCPISLAFLGVQQTVGCQSTRATPWIAPRQPKLPQARLPTLNVSAASESTTAGGLKAASSNASAASESTTAGGLEAFPLSKLRWSREV